MAPAALTPAIPIGMNGAKLPSCTAVTAIPTNMTRIATLIRTMTALARVLSRTPASRANIASSTTTAAGTLTRPPSIGPDRNSWGRVRPVVRYRNSLMYWPHPTPMAATGP